MQRKFSIIFSSVVLTLASLLNSCGNSQQLEEFLSADPSLSQTDKTTGNDSSEAIAAEQKDIQLTKLPKRNSPKNSEFQVNQESTTETKVADLPENLPFYPQATLELITPESTLEKGVSEWRSQDSVNTIINYYQQKWQDADWQIVEPFATDAKNNLTAIVNRDNLDYTILLTPTQSEKNQQETQLTISYQPVSSNSSAGAESPEEQLTAKTNNLQENNITTESNNLSGPENPEDSTLNPINESENQDSINFSDIAETPEQLRQYVLDLAKLGILTAKTKELNPDSRQFKPNEVITRREYAKWLVEANNKFYGNNPGNQISVASKSSNPAFKDIGVNDPDFAEIQGLAEAGLIPSVLTKDSSSLLFKPDAPLTREDLITWKVPLDIRQGLPKADATAISEAWGFQDTNNIDAKALQALFADYQNGDRSNVKRLFGYTTLFQPKKAVTRAEAAASLWYFGYQGEGVTPEDILNAPE